MRDVELINLHLCGLGYNIKNTNTNRSTIKRNITFKNVSFTYPDTGIQALKDISFSLKENESLGIFGKTGSGKATIANLLCRMYDVNEGEILYDTSKITHHYNELSFSITMNIKL